MQQKLLILTTIKSLEIQEIQPIVVAMEKVKDENMAATTPMMKQYQEIKQAHKDYLLFYRMGDFYELFFEDASIASGVLDIALTRRGKHDGQDIPMCGVPVHSSDSYLHKLIKSGYKVAVCEQLEDPAEAKKRGAKSVVKRDVVRIITSGTITEDTLLDSASSNFLASVVPNKEEVSVAWGDISTGELFVVTIPFTSLGTELARINPKEILIPDRIMEDSEYNDMLKEWRGVLTTQVASLFESAKGERKIKQFYGVKSFDSFGEYQKSELGACGALLDYIEVTQKGKVPRLDIPRKFVASNYMVIDAATRRNLELFCTISGEYKGSLLSVIDMTKSSGGRRLLYKFLSAPLLNKNEIDERLAMVSFFIERNDVKAAIQQTLGQLPDIERALSRICLQRGSTRDLAAIRDGIEQVMKISSLLEFCGDDLPAGIRKCMDGLGRHEILYSNLKNALMDMVPPNQREGGFIREGYHPKLDEYRSLRKDSEVFKNSLRDKYREETGIDSLRIVQNNILGYFVEVTPQKASRVPSHFIHRQTLASAVRYTTEELRELEQDIINSESYAIELEMEIFAELVDKVKVEAENLASAARNAAMIDVMASLANLAEEKNYCRPQIDDGFDFHVKGGRHPIVEAAVQSNFIKNDCDLSPEQRVWLLTGPNMAGKSTFLRQNALIAIMAQMGCYVPADEVRIGMVDRVFSRVGAADDLARGQSTFMVEMVETATILNHATRRSLVILDEIGRGTATFDGLSIAWAVVERIHDANQCRSLFATHYHELTSLASKLSSLACYTMKVQEWMGDVIFLHEVVAGTADRSYGIHVARLAGLPQEVTDRAREILKLLEQGENLSSIPRTIEDLPLFSMSSLQYARGHEDIERIRKEDELKTLIKDANPDNMTPKDAMDFLYKLHEIIKE